MASPEAVKKPRRTTFSKMASIFCFVEPRVHERASSPLNAEPHKTGAIEHMGKVDALVKARTSLVLGTPVNLVEATQQHSLKKEELQKQKDRVADLTGKLQRITEELKDEKAHSAQLQAKVDELTADSRDRAVVATLTSKIFHRVVQRAAAAEKASMEAEAEERILVTRLVAKAQLRAVARVIAEDTASEAATQREHDLDVLKQESERREEDLTAKVVRLSEQVDEAKEMDNLKKDKLKELMARDLEKNQKLAAANKRAEEMDARLEDMGCEMECLQEALVQLPVIPEEDCRFIKDLGEGTFGQVTLRCIPVAVKEMKKPEDALSLLKEQHMMARLRHQAIPGAMAWMQKKDGSRGLAIQYVDGQSMEQFREKRSAGGNMDLDPSGPAGLSVLERLTRPIEHIHQQGHVHRDISCRNVMISEDYDGNFSPYLIDFGLCYDMRTPPTGWGGSPAFMRPVVALYPQSKGPEDDVRGFCAVAWEFLSGRDIWQTLHDDYKAAIDANFSIEEDVEFCCDQHNLNPGHIVPCLAVAEYLGHIGIGEEHFEPMLNNPLMPAKALRLIARGLSSAVARGEAAPPSLADIRAALEADREEAEVAHLMSLLGCRL